MHLTCSKRYRWLIVGAGMLMMLLLATACTGVPTTTSPTSAATTTTTTSGTTPGASQPTPTQPAITAVPGSIQFIGPIKSINASSLVVQMPDEPLTMSITSQTDRSHYKGVSPAPGQIVKVETSFLNGSFVATKLEPADSKDATKQNIVEYHGQTSSVVGTDNMLHFVVGNKSWSFPITTTTDLSNFNNNAHSIQQNQRVKVEVQFAGTSGTVLKVDTDNGS
jgi:hypothetical protein